MKVVVIGELCEDKFIYGNVKRLSPEAPVPVFVPIHTETNRGMAGNVVENFRTFVQRDKVELICQVNKITKTRYVDEKSNHMFIRVDEGDDNVDRFILNGLSSSLIRSADLVIISDYNKGFLSNQDIVEISKLSNNVVIDTKKVLTRDIIESVSYIKLNEVEYQNNHDLISLYPEKVIVTLGMNGAQYMGKGIHQIIQFKLWMLAALGIHLLLVLLITDILLILTFQILLSLQIRWHQELLVKEEFQYHENINNRNFRVYR